MKLSIPSHLVLSLFCAVSFLPAATLAQVLGGTEGPVLSITASNDGGCELNIMGVTVLLPPTSFAAGTIAAGPGNPLTPDDVCGNGSLSTALPGREEGGFLGATAKCEVADIVTDESLTGTVGAMIGRECILEAAENVMLAWVTEVEVTGDNSDPANCKIYIGDGGLELVPNPDPRYPFGGAINTEGFPIDYCSIQPQSSIGAEGYYGSADGKFYIFAAEAGSGTIIGDTDEFTTIFRVDCEDQDELEVRGSITNEAQTEVRIYLVNGVTEQFVGTADVGAFDAVAGVRTFRYRNRNFNFDCSEAIKAETDQASFTFDL